MKKKHDDQKQELKNKHDDSLDEYISNFMPWFSSDAYQLWSIHNRNNNSKFDGTTRSFKMPAKEYIYDLDKNDYYKDYKTKVNSKYLKARNRYAKVSLVYNDGTIILK